MRYEDQFTNESTNQKGIAAPKKSNYPQLTPEQRRYVEATYNALLKIYSRKFAKANVYGLQAADAANFAIAKVVANVNKYMHRTAQHTANAIADNSFRDMWRRELAQRGHGARGKRVVLGDNPISAEESDSGTLLDNHAGEVVNPDAWIEQDHHNNVINDVRELMSDVAFHGFVLTTIHGLTQEDAADALCVSRCHLNREMRKATKRLKAMGTSYDAWGVQQ